MKIKIFLLVHKQRIMLESKFMSTFEINARKGIKDEERQGVKCRINIEQDINYCGKIGCDNFSFF